MSETKQKLKELIFECETEKEALQLLQSYRKKNFHLVSKKITNPNPSSDQDSTVALKLIRFRQASLASDLETVWENFVHEMTDMGAENSFIVEVLTRIRSKERFWEVHPHDHLRDILMDSTNFIKSDQLSKVLVLVASKEVALNFFNVYQNSIASMIDSMGIFVMVPIKLKSSFSTVKISPKVQILSYDKDADLSKYQKDIDMKIGLIVVTPEDVDFIKQSAFADNIKSQNLSLLVSNHVEQTIFADISYKKYLVDGYNSENSSQDLFNTFYQILKLKMNLAFFWNKDGKSSILNSEAQVLKILDDCFENRSTQHLGN